MKTGSLDLNLLTALAALLEEQHVGRAARRIGLSQSALSEALGRLRRHFGDELLLRIGNRYELTPLGADLRSSAATAMEFVERTFTTGARFDPAGCEREFVLLASDYAASVLGPALLATLADAAPLARLRLLPVPRKPADPPTVSARRVDGFLMPRGMAVPGFAGTDLFHDTWTCVVDARQTLTLTTEMMATAGWVLQDTTVHANPVLDMMRARGIEPDVRCVVGDFHSIPHLVRDSDRIGLAPARIAALWGGSVRTLPLPGPAPLLVETLWWHPSHTADPAHRWLRDTASATGRAL